MLNCLKHGACLGHPKTTVLYLYEELLVQQVTKKKNKEKKKN